jgi:hypothetical protein
MTNDQAPLVASGPLGADKHANDHLLGLSTGNMHDLRMSLRNSFQLHPTSLRGIDPDVATALREL